MSIEVFSESGIKLFDNKERDEESLRMVHQLIAIGANVAFTGYIDEDKKLIKKFSRASLKVIAPTWPHLDDRVKVSVVNEHAHEFNDWIAGKAE